MRPPEPLAMLAFFEATEDARESEETLDQRIALRRVERQHERNQAARRRRPTTNSGGEGESLTSSDNGDGDADYD